MTPFLTGQAAIVPILNFAERVKDLLRVTWENMEQCERHTKMLAEIDLEGLEEENRFMKREVLERLLDKAEVTKESRRKLLAAVDRIESAGDLANSILTRRTKAFAVYAKTSPLFGKIPQRIDEIEALAQAAENDPENRTKVLALRRVLYTTIEELEGGKKSFPRQVLEKLKYALRKASDEKKLARARQLLEENIEAEVDTLPEPATWLGPELIRTRLKIEKTITLLSPRKPA